MGNLSTLTDHNGKTDSERPRTPASNYPRQSYPMPNSAGKDSHLNCLSTNRDLHVLRLVFVLDRRCRNRRLFVSLDTHRLDRRDILVRRRRMVKGRLLSEDILGCSVGLRILRHVVELEMDRLGRELELRHDLSDSKINNSISQPI